MKYQYLHLHFASSQKNYLLECHASHTRNLSRESQANNYILKKKNPVYDV